MRSVFLKAQVVTHASGSTMLPRKLSITPPFFPGMSALETGPKVDASMYHPTKFHDLPFNGSQRRINPCMLPRKLSWRLRKLRPVGKHSQCFNVSSYKVSCRSVQPFRRSLYTNTQTHSPRFII